MRALFMKIGEWLAGAFSFTAFNATQRFALLSALITYFLVVYGVLLATIVGIVNFTPSAPGGFVALGLSALPGNVFQCMSAIGAAHVACQLFIMKAKIIRMSAGG